MNKSDVRAKEAGSSTARAPRPTETTSELLFERSFTCKTHRYNEELDSAVAPLSMM